MKFCLDLFHNIFFMSNPTEEQMKKQLKALWKDDSSKITLKERNSS